MITWDKLIKTTKNEVISDVLTAIFSAIDSKKAVKRSVQFAENIISIKNNRFELSPNARLIVVGAGKASAAMAQAAFEIFGGQIDKGLIITKDDHSPVKKIGNIEIFEASHPVPDYRGIQASEKLLETVSDLTKDDLVLVLTSGGGSALTTLPVKGINLVDLQNLTRELLQCGASINEINCLRKHLTQVSGGGLAKKVQPARVVSLIISDVVSSLLDVIASGMTAPDSTTFADALQVLEQYKLVEKVAPNIIEHLQKGIAGDIAETPKAYDILWQDVHNFIIADNVLAVNAAVEKAKELGFETQILTTYLEGEAREVGKVFAAIAREFANKTLTKPMLLVAGGETTVTIRGNGKGGRNQELALGAVKGIAGLENVVLVSLATDGGDGTPEAAGAIIDGNTLENAQNLNLSPDDFLQRNDSFNFFEPLGALLQTGATMTNVNDLLLIFIAPKAHTA